MKLEIYDIDWDTSGWDCELYEGPHSANIPDVPFGLDFDEEDLEDIGIDEESTDSEIVDIVSDWLSDNYGFCVNGFSFKRID